MATTSNSKRFENIEDARETLSFLGEDLHEVDVLTRAGNRVLALNIAEKLIADVEAATVQFPEMHAELLPMTAKIAPYIKQIIDSK